MDSNTVFMFSQYVWQFHNLETLLKTFFLQIFPFLLFALFLLELCWTGVGRVVETVVATEWHTTYAVEDFKDFADFILFLSQIQPCRNNASNIMQEGAHQHFRQVGADYGQFLLLLQIWPCNKDQFQFQLF